jgi:hypothetical protein
MTIFRFVPAAPPFRRWMGPYCPSRGTLSGLRVTQRQLGAWVTRNGVSVFWTVKESAELASFVTRRWGGGRVLLLPNGIVVKPLQHDDEVGIRAFIGRFRGRIVLESPDGDRFEMNRVPHAKPGLRWPGSATDGLECVAKPDGSVRCYWYHPKGRGRVTESILVSHPDAYVAHAFSAVRSGETAGRVRITSTRHVITNRQMVNDSWESVVLFRYSPGFPDWSEFISEETL